MTLEPGTRLEPITDPRVHEVMEFIRAEIARAFTVPACAISYYAHNPEAEQRRRARAWHATADLRAELVRLQTQYAWPSGFVPIPKDL